MGLFIYGIVLIKSFDGNASRSSNSVLPWTQGPVFKTQPHHWARSEPSVSLVIIADRTFLSCVKKKSISDSTALSPWTYWYRRRQRESNITNAKNLYMEKKSRYFVQLRMVYTAHILRNIIPSSEENKIWIISKIGNLEILETPTWKWTDALIFFMLCRTPSHQRRWQ